MDPLDKFEILDVFGMRPSIQEFLSIRTQTILEDASEHFGIQWNRLLGRDKEGVDFRKAVFPFSTIRCMLAGKIRVTYEQEKLLQTALEYAQRGGHISNTRSWRHASPHVLIHAINSCLTPEQKSVLMYSELDQLL